MLHQFAQRPVQEFSRRVSEDSLPRLVEKFQLAVKTGKAQQNRRWVVETPRLPDVNLRPLKRDKDREPFIIDLLSGPIISITGTRSVR